MNSPVMTAQMTPANNRQGVRVDVDVLYLDDIPKAMDNMGWNVSAQLMRRWFATKPAWAMPVGWRLGERALGVPIEYTNLPISQVDDQIVKMAWATDPRFIQVDNALALIRKSWLTPKSVSLLKSRLVRKGWASGKTVRLGSAHSTALQLDQESQLNALKFGGEWDTLNDYFGALFKATLKVAVVGKAYQSLLHNKDIFEIEKLGFYIRDTYDFNAGWLDDAFMGLGVWDKKRVLSKADMLEFKALTTPHPATLIARHLRYPGFVQVRNLDFRRWQDQRNEGGDFFVFSDVLWENYKGPGIEIE